MQAKDVEIKSSHSSKSGDVISILKKNSSSTKSSFKQASISDQRENDDLINKLVQSNTKNKTPFDIELEIQTERIMIILEKVIKRLTFASCIPFLLRCEGKVLREHFTPSEKEFIMDVVNQYTPNIQTPSVQSIAGLSQATYMSKLIDEISMKKIPIEGSMEIPSDKISLLREKPDMIIDPHMSQAIEIITHNPYMREHLQDYMPFIDSNCKTFISSIKSLKAAALQKLNVTAIQERQREKELRAAWKENNDAKLELEEIEKQFDEQRLELGAQLAEKENIILDYRMKIDRLMAKFREDIKKRVQESEQGMAEDTQASNIRQAELAVEAKQVQQQYQVLLQEHLVHEKELRAKRFKVETQLSNWLAKYDHDMGERQAELDEITEGFEEEKAELEALQEKFDEQEVDYRIMVAEKEEAERKYNDQLALEFLIYRSARFLQRRWREYLERKYAKRKKKKKKKGKKKGPPPPPAPFFCSLWEKPIDILSLDRDPDEIMEEEPEEEEEEEGPKKFFSALQI